MPIKKPLLLTTKDFCLRVYRRNHSYWPFFLTPPTCVRCTQTLLLFSLTQCTIVHHTDTKACRVMWLILSLNVNDLILWGIPQYISGAVGFILKLNKVGLVVFPIPLGVHSSSSTAVMALLKKDSEYCLGKWLHQ